MKKVSYTVLIVLLLAATFLAGSWYGRRGSAVGPPPGERRVLYYVDPMNPAHTSQEPGFAPCGMKMEPVYADDNSSADPPGSDPMVPGTVKITPEKQQIIGVRTGQAELAPRTHVIRTLGRVTLDENRVYRVVTGADGWVREVFCGTTGSVVKKGQVLASLYNSNFLNAQQAFIRALNVVEAPEADDGVEESQPLRQLAANNVGIRTAADVLRTLGMDDTQLEEISRTRQVTRDIAVRAPVTGLVLARNVAPGLIFDRGTELYSLADLSVVWILADLFENEAQYFRPGTKAQVVLPHRTKTFIAKVSEVPPQFDPATRTLKVRLEMNNPGFELRPEMFVDVELPIDLPASLSVPVDAVLDSGLQKTVFVDRGHGLFEPRKVETGWRLGERVEILSGLTPAERIVVSGTFLLDSESRMKMAAAGMSGAAEKLPPAGMPGGTENLAAPAVSAKAEKMPVASEPGKTRKMPAAAMPGKTKNLQAGAMPGMTGHTEKLARSAAFEKMPAAKMPEPIEHAVAPMVAAKADSLPSASMFETAEAQAAEIPGGETGKQTLEQPPEPVPASLVDPVCGMDVEKSKAEARGLKSEYQGKIYYFCGPSCKKRFDESPDKFVEKLTPAPEAQTSMPPAPSGPESTHDQPHR